MTGHGVLPGLWPFHGDGVLARQGDLVLLIHPAGGTFTNRLLDLLADAARAGQSGLRFTELVSAEFDVDAAAADAPGDRYGPAVVAFGPAGGGTAVAVYGTGWAEVTTAYGAQRLSAGEPYGRLRCVLPSALTMITAGVQPVPPDSETDPYLRLAGGVIRAVALIYAPAEIEADAGAGRHAVPGRSRAPEPEPELVQEPESEYHATQAEPVIFTPYVPEVQQPVPDPHAPEVHQQGPGPAGGGAARPDFIAILLAPGELGGEVPKRDPLPLGAEPADAVDLGLVEIPSEMVEGIYCKHEHFNDPEARYCAVCGISMSQLTKLRHQGKRPPLGVLILGDGSVCQLDADYVIGREPTLDSAVADRRARPLRLTDASEVVSRVHARVELDGWQVFLTDLKSANGTQVLLPGAERPTSLQPGVRLPLAAGTQIRLGGEYGLQYDSHRHR